MAFFDRPGPRLHQGGQGTHARGHWATSQGWAAKVGAGRPRTGSPGPSRAARLRYQAPLPGQLHNYTRGNIQRLESVPFHSRLSDLIGRPGLKGHISTTPLVSGDPWHATGNQLGESIQAVPSAAIHEPTTSVGRSVKDGAPGLAID